MRPAQGDLLAVVERIFADGIVAPRERRELVSLYRGADLTVSEVRQVFVAFVEATWSASIADVALTDGERAKLKTIVRELYVPRDCVPNSVAWLVAA